MSQTYRKRSSSGQHGFSLIESAIVLGVIGLIVAAIWIAAASVQQSLKIKRMAEGMLLIYDGVNAQYKNFSTTATLSQATGNTPDPIVQLDYVPRDFVKGNKLVDPWGVGIDLSLDTTGTRYLSVSIHGTGAESCIKLATQFLIQGYDNLTPNGWTKIYQTWTWGGTVTMDYSTGWGKPTLATLSGACPTDTWTLSFAYKL